MKMYGICTKGQYMQTPLNVKVLISNLNRSFWMIGSVRVHLSTSVAVHVLFIDYKSQKSAIHLLLIR